jgi:hypothetical protein
MLKTGYNLIYQAHAWFYVPCGDHGMVFENSYVLGSVAGDEYAILPFSALECVEPASYPIGIQHLPRIAIHQSRLHGTPF